MSTEYDAYRLTMLESAIWELEQFQKQARAWAESGRDMPSKVVLTKVNGVLSMAALGSREFFEKFRSKPGPVDDPRGQDGESEGR